MKLFRIRSLLVMCMAALLAACGGSADLDIQVVPAQTAGFVQKVDVAAVQQPVPNLNPAPDCAPEGCNSLRIIDGNAEAYRIDAMRRAAVEANIPGPHS